jgi:glycosyltransferase involved in cell wall biosynthesis
MFRAIQKSKLRRFSLFVQQRELFEGLCYIATRLGMRLPQVRQRPRPAAQIKPPSRAARIRIVACLHSLALEGAPISLIEMLIGLIRMSQFEVLVLSAQDGPLAERASRAGIAVHIKEAPQDYAAGDRAYEKAIADYARVLDQFAPDLIIANSLVSFHAIDAARFVGIRSMWLIREADAPERFVEKYPRALQSRALACLSYPVRIVFASHATMAAWPPGNVPLKLIRTVPDLDSIASLRRWNRIEARRSLGLLDIDTMVLCVGTLCANKGQSDLIAAVAQSADGLRAVLVGAPASPGGPAIMRAVRRHPGDATIQAHAPTPDIGRFYASADVYVCSSRSESYPRTILEALAFGLPIVTTLVGGITEVLGDTKVLTYLPGDVQTLREALVRIRESPELGKSMAESSRKRWEEIRHEPISAAQYAAEIQDILAP